MDEFAPQSALVDPPGNAITEPDQDALSQRLVGHSTGTDVQSFRCCDSKKLLMQWPDLPRRDAVDTRLAKRIQFELVCRCILPGAQQQPEIGRGIVPAAQEVLSSFTHLAGGITQQEIAALSQRREQ